ncbi:hypothetical protein DXX93_11265 [Thalassotalea euphylliae]|uniref:Uncharacterized protein n=1 Tax=Thalassotalea euphylliae TaxID=1655234 RepID=A0A3E0TRG1_9GAMM|nr:hypothetical protein DXX93_11265 [Thalassotalea euphylliae]
MVSDANASNYRSIVTTGNEPLVPESAISIACNRYSLILFSVVAEIRYDLLLTLYRFIIAMIIAIDLVALLEFFCK